MVWRGERNVPESSILENSNTPRILKNLKDSGISAVSLGVRPSKMPASPSMKGRFQNLKIVQHAGLAELAPPVHEELPFV
jgi:hypothetical protein